MKGKLGITLFFVIFLAIGLSGCLGTTHLKTISKQVNIPYHSSSALTGNAGILYCKGLVVETNSGVDYIQLIWMADVKFPSNSVAGYVSWGDTWAGYEDAPMSIISPPNNPGHANKWFYDIGLQTIWTLGMNIYRDDTYFKFMSNTYGVHDAFYASDRWGTGIGYDDIAEGRHNIFSAFASELIPTDKPFDEMDIQIKTSPFILVRQGADFWFE